MEAVGGLGRVTLQDCDLDNETRRNLPLQRASRKPERREEILTTTSIEGMYRKTISSKALLKEKVKMILPRRAYYFVSGAITGRN